jgi:integrase
MGRRRTKHFELPERVYRPYRMYYYVPPNGKRIPLGRDFAQAMAEYARLIDRPRSLTTLGDIFDRYQLEVLPTKAPRTQQDNLREFLSLRKSFAHMAPQDLTAQDVYRHMDARGAPIRANREKALLSHICSYAIRWGAMTSNPCRDVKRNPEFPRDRYVTDAELAAFIALAPRLIRIYVEFKYATAMRKGDILGLRLTQLTDEGIEYYESKKRRRRRVARGGQIVLEEVPPRRRLVRWTPELRAIVERAKALPRRSGVDQLFTRRDGLQLTAERLDALWQRVMRKAVAAGIKRFTEHDLRAKSATDAPETAQHRLGHTTGQQTQAYLRSRTTDAYDPIPLPSAPSPGADTTGAATPVKSPAKVIPFPKRP